MSKTKHLDKYKWKKGESGNPTGVSKDERSLSNFKRLNKVVVADIFNQYSMSAPEDLAKIDSGKLPYMEAIIVKALQVAHSKGDLVMLNLILDRIVGKVKEEVEVRVPRPVIIEKLNGDQEILTAIDVTEEDE